MRLRLALCARRKAGDDFPAAWNVTLPTVLASVTPDDRAGWSSAFSATRNEWENAYTRTGHPLKLGGLDLFPDESGGRDYLLA